jgi:hypothetical protein
MAGPQGLAGLTGLTPTVTPTAVNDPGATAPEIHGGPANPAHGQLEWDNPVPWAIQQGISMTGQPLPNPDPAMLGQPGGHAAGAGSDPEAYADANLTRSHAAPWPWQHIPDSGAVNSREATAAQSIANTELHAYDAGDAREFTHIEPPTDHKMPWGIDPHYVSSGLEAGTPVGGLQGNNRTGWDRFAGGEWAVPGDNINRFGFDSAHVTRFAPTTAAELPVPRADSTVQGAQRPMVMNVPGRYGSYPVGAGSPFAGQLPGVGNNVGAAEIGVPSDYQPPPDAPTNVPLQQAGSPAPVWGWSGLGW